MLDEMAITKHVSWNDTRYTGFVDFGNGIEDDSASAAKDALVFIAVNVNGSWKVPLAYILLIGSESADLATICIHRISDLVICDGPYCHLTMLSTLGASFNPTNLVALFRHPFQPNGKLMCF